MSVEKWLVAKKFKRYVLPASIGTGQYFIVEFTPPYVTTELGLLQLDLDKFSEIKGLSMLHLRLSYETYSLDRM